MPTLSAGSTATDIVQPNHTLIVTCDTGATASIVEIGQPGTEPGTPHVCTAPRTTLAMFATTSARQFRISASAGSVTYTVQPTQVPPVQAGQCQLVLDQLTGGTPSLTSRAARGTAANPTATLSGDVLLAIGARTWAGTSGYTASLRGFVRQRAAEDHTDTAQGTYWEISTIAAGGTTGGVKITVHNSGRLDFASGVIVEYADDAAAQAGGVPVGGMYRTGSALKIRAA